MIEYATLDGVTLQDLSIDSVVQTESVAGLSGFPQIRGEVYDDPDGDGVIEPADQFIGARVSSWECAVFGATMASARANWSTLHKTLLAATRQQKQLRWRWSGDTLAFQANVRVAGMTAPVFQGGIIPCFKFQLLLRAADPLNYDQNSVTQVTGASATGITGITWPVVWPVPWAIVVTGVGSIAAVNAGDAEAWPLIDITGPIVSPVIQNSTSGKALYFDGLTVPSGQTLSINMRSAVATIGGVSKKSTLRLSSSEFFSVSAGATESISFSGTGTGINTAMTVTMRSAYLT